MPRHHGEGSLMGRPLLSLFCFTLCVFTACRPKPSRLIPVTTWLLCEECVAGELDSVTALGNRAVGGLAAALRGPPPERYENVRRQILASYDKLEAAPGESLSTSRQKYVEHFLSNYVANYQGRAAIALESIGTPQARAVLLAALRRDSVYRMDVRRILGLSLGATLDRLRGDGQIGTLGSFVPTDPTVQLRDKDSLPVARIRVVFSVDSGLGRIADSIQLTDGNGIASVRWQLDSVDSMNVLRAVAAGQTARFHAIGRPPTAGTAHLVFTVQPVTSRAGVFLEPAVRVTAVDSSGNPMVSFTGNVSVAIMPGTGDSTAVLGGTTTVAAVNGVATFSALRIHQTGTGYRLSATASSLGGATSAPFDILTR